MGIQTNVVAKNGNPPISYNILQGESNEYPRNIIFDANYVEDIRIDMQSKIDKIDERTCILDIVASKVELDDYDRTKLKNGDIVKVMIDFTYDDATTYYRWSQEKGEFEYAGEFAPYYTQSETDALLSVIQERIDNYTAVDESQETILFNQQS